MYHLINTQKINIHKLKTLVSHLCFIMVSELMVFSSSLSSSTRIYFDKNNHLGGVRNKKLWPYQEQKQSSEGSLKA